MATTGATLEKSASKSSYPKPDPTKSPKNQDETVLMAMNIYGEARNQPIAGQSAIGQVVYNRVHGIGGRKPGCWGSCNSVTEVITHPAQFSWLNVPGSDAYKNVMRPREDKAWKQAYELAKMTLAGGGIANLTNKNGYVADSYCRNSPKWAKEANRVVTIKDHKFYALYKQKLSGAPAEEKAAVAKENTPATAAENSGEAAPKVAEVLNAEKADKAVKWYKGEGKGSRKPKAFPPDLIKRIQAEVGIAQSGNMTESDVQAVAAWQKGKKDKDKKELTADGMFGTSSASVATVTDKALETDIEKLMPPKQQKTSSGDGGRTQKLKELFGFVPSSTYNSKQKKIIETNHIQNIKVKVHGKTGQDTTRSLQVHKKLANSVQSIFNDIYTNAPTFKVHNAGGFSYRVKNNGTNTTALSTHSFGTAVDINADLTKTHVDSADAAAESTLNPFLHGAEERKKNVGQDSDTAIRTANHPVVKAFAKYGFGWGGRYGDYMHFSYFNGS